MTVVNGTFTGNTASEAGGGAAFQPSPCLSSTVDINECTFDDNQGLHVRIACCRVNPPPLSFLFRPYNLLLFSPDLLFLAQRLRPEEVFMLSLSILPSSPPHCPETWLPLVALLQPTVPPRCASASSLAMTAPLWFPT